MNFHGAGRDAERFGNLFVLHAPADVMHDLFFARRQSRAHAPVHRSHRTVGKRVLDPDFALPHRPQAFHHGAHRYRLFENAARPQLQRPEAIDFGEIVHPQHRLAAAPRASHIGDELEDLLQARALIDQHNVGMARAHHVQRIIETGRRTQIFELGALRENPRQAFEHDRLRFTSKHSEWIHVLFPLEI